MVAILFSCAEPFNYCQYPLDREPNVNFVKFAQAVSEKTFKKKMAAVVAMLDFRSAKS